MKTVTKTFVKENDGVEVGRTRCYIHYHLPNGKAVKTRIPKAERVAPTK